MRLADQPTEVVGMTMEQSLRLLFGVLTVMVTVAIVLAVQRDRRGKGERVPRDSGRITCWVVGLVLIALGALIWAQMGAVPDYLGTPEAGMVVLPLCAFGILGVVRPHWAAWGLAISALILPLATSLIIRACEGGTPEIWYGLYGIPALLTAAFLRQSIPGSALDRSRAKGPLVRQ